MTSRSYSCLHAIGICLIAMTSPRLLSAQSSSDSGPRFYWGMDAAFTRYELGESGYRNQFTSPTQSLHVSGSIGDAFRLEVPFGLLMSKYSGSHWTTQLNSGLIGDVFPGRLTGRHSAGAQSGFFLGGGPLVSYYRSASNSQAQYGVIGRGGYEGVLGSTHLRLAGEYDRFFATSEMVDRRDYGLTMGVLFPMERDSVTKSGKLPVVGSWYVGTRAGINHSMYHRDESVTQIAVPKPYFNAFYFPGAQRRAAVGLRTTVQYFGGLGASAQYFQIDPRTEINLLRESWSRPGIQLGAHAIVEHLRSSGASGYHTSDTSWGAGGDVSLSLPVMPTMFKFGIGVDRFAGEGSRRPSETNVRFDVAIDRFLNGRR